MWQGPVASGNIQRQGYCAFFESKVKAVVRIVWLTKTYSVEELIKIFTENK